MQEVLRAVLADFGRIGEPVEIEPIKTGHINQTLRVRFNEPGGPVDYIVQSVNQFVFKQPKLVMENIVGVCAHLKKRYERAGKPYDRKVLQFLTARDGNYYSIQPDGSFWRAYYMVPHSVTHNTVTELRHLENAAASFGAFCDMLSDYDMSSLHETIPNFHNTPERFKTFTETVEINRSGRAKDVREEIDFVLQRESFVSTLTDALARGELQNRVTHNDTKYNNVLLDIETGESLAVIDLDTIMPGLAAYDFGDAIRFAGNKAAEDEADLSKVGLSIENFEAFARGYVGALNGALNSAELSSLPTGAIMMTLECGLRFLADYVDGDRYFHCNYPEHNLVRARNQFALVKDLERNYDKMQQIIERFR